MNILKRITFLATIFCVQQVFAQPTISSFSPVAGAAGTTVTLTGTNFNTTAANNIVYFGATKATVNTASATSLSVTVPTGATYQPISIFNTASSLTGFSSVPYGFLTTFTSKNSITSSDFDAVQNFTAGTAPSGICIVDIDGDGKADIATVNNASGNISVLRNTSTSGTVSFASKVDITEGHDAIFLVAGDIDNDGKPDLIATDTYMNSFAGYGNTVTVFRNTSTPGSISFASGVSFTVNTEPYAVAIGDINGDGKPDLAVANYNGGTNSGATVSILRNTSTSGSISFATKTDLSVTDAAGGVSIGDLDGDGKPDIAVANSGSFGNYGNSVSVFLNSTTTGSNTLSFGSKQDFTVGSSPYPVNVTDIDGDGKNDLVTANFANDNISVLRNTSSSGSISFASQATFGTGNGNSYLGVGDLDGDGKADLAVANFGSSSTGNTVSILRNNSTSGSISFDTKVDLTTGTAPYMAAIGDLDGDGKADIAVSNYGTSNDGTTVSVLRNNPQSVLPLRLLSFTGKLINNDQQVELDWQTTDEKDVSHYEAEWSTDSKSWQQVISLAATNKDGTNNYSCIHNGLSATNFYRLKMIDIDGKFTYSNILRIDKFGGSLPIIYPNPVRNTLTITGLSNGRTQINLFSANGKVMLRKEVNTTAVSIDISNLSQGLYLIQITEPEKTFTYKLEKE